MDVPPEFAELDLYAVLEIDKSADDKAVRKAYLRRALRTHPDKPGGSDLAFRQVAFANSVLSTPSYRKQYDATGKLDFREDAAIADLFSRDFRVEITPEMIDEDRRIYQDSTDEEADVARMYERFEGDFGLVLEGVIHSTADDQERLIELIQGMIDAGRLTKLPKFSRTTTKKQIAKRKREAAGEAAEVAEQRTELGLDTETGLAALIQKRQQERSGSSLIDQLEAKYSVKKTKTKQKKAKA